MRPQFEEKKLFQRKICYHAAKAGIGVRNRSFAEFSLGKGVPNTIYYRGRQGGRIISGYPNRKAPGVTSLYNL